MVVVIVEATLTDRHGPGGHLGANGGRIARRVEVGGVVRMDSCGKKNATGIFGGDPARPLRGVERFPDRDDGGGPCRECPVYNITPIRLESRIGEMGMRVEKAQELSPLVTPPWRLSFRRPTAWSPSDRSNADTCFRSRGESAMLHRWS